MAVFARDRSGRLHQRSMVDGEWRGWVTLGGPRGGQPSAFASQDGRIDLFVRGPGNVAYHRTYSNGRWGGWSSLGGVISGSPTASANGDRVNVFVRGSDYTLWQQDLVDGAGTWWSQRDQFASNALTGAVGAAAGTGGTAWVAVRGPDNAVHVSTLSGS
ncbi:hypothetical protein [Lentzea sp.]|uniref:hypothetical protein n=1 Tax=Lentzea sp. TaxID=56099 RepID=UPI002B5268B8|nr:hypothetical protein [Lentzea sp.]HUQ61419.1 hypothetical protein [Lentzea sp.]